MEVAWNQLDPRLRGVDGLDDIMRFDLQHFCRRMQPPDEPHYRYLHHVLGKHVLVTPNNKHVLPTVYVPSDLM